MTKLSNSGLRILIVDDHSVVRRGIRSILEAEQSWTVAGEAGDGREALHRAVSCKPDVVIMDISMPESNGLDATRRILEDLPGTKVLILTMHRSEEILTQAIAAGARGVLLKSDIGDDLVDAVRTIAAGRLFFTAAMSEGLRDTFRRKEGEPGAGCGPNSLTTREREVVQLVCEGFTNKEIAAKLNMSVRTAETHRSHIMAKLGVSSLGDLVRWAIRNHIIEP